MRSPRATTPPTSCRLRPPLKSPLCAHQTCLSAPPRMLTPPSITIIAPSPIFCQFLVFVLTLFGPQRRRGLPSVNNARFRTVPRFAILYCSTFPASPPLMYVSFTIGPHAHHHPSCTSLCALVSFTFDLRLVSLLFPSDCCVFLSSLLCSKSSGLLVLYITSRCPRRSALVLYTGSSCI